MKKITRLGIEDLRNKMYTLSTLEQKTIIGGQRVAIRGGYLEEVNGGVFYYGNNGCSVFFEGVQMSISNIIPDYTAYQFNGNIGIEEEWCNSSFTVYDFAHEYGHYLQQKEMGMLSYLFDVAIPSMYSVSTNLEEHSQQEYEQDATMRGNQYLSNNTVWQ